MSLGSMTHSFDSNQRSVQLALTPPPGYYMLFLLDASRTPSVAAIVRVY